MSKTTLDDLRAVDGITVSRSHPMPGLPFEVWAIDGPGYSTTIKFREDGRVFDPDDQEAVDRLADPDLHAERAFAATEPEAHAAITELRRLGYNFTISDSGVSYRKGSGKATAATPDELRELAEKARPK